MRKINWDEKLTDDDIAWLRQAGSIMTEEQIARHQEQFDAEVPESEVPEDEGTRSALDPNAGADSFVAPEGASAPRVVDPREDDPQEETEDDYDQWGKDELEAEVTARNSMPDTSKVEVEGTGKNGAVLKADLIKGLRLWDSENPNALS